MSLPDLEFITDEAIPESVAIERLIEYLCPKFESDLMSSLSTSEAILRGPEFPQFEDFFMHMRQTVKTCACQTSWNKPTLIGGCFQCARGDSACVCLPCLLAGNHEGHDIFIRRGSAGNCDCGDELHWDPAGFCEHHCGRSPNPELSLERRIRVGLIAITAASFSNLKFHALYDRHSFLLTIKWILRFVYLGDSTRRCVVLGMQRASSFFDLLVASWHAGSEDFKELLGFLGFFANDSLFSEYSAQGLVLHFPEVIRLHLKFARFRDSDVQKEPLANSTASIKALHMAFEDRFLSKFLVGVNWVDIVMDSLRVIQMFVYAVVTYQDYRKMRMWSLFNYLGHLLAAGIAQKDVAMNESFVMLLSDFLAEKLEFTWLTVREFGDKANDTEGKSHVTGYFCRMFHSLLWKYDENVTSVYPVMRLAQFLREVESDSEASVLEQNVPFGLTYFLHVLAFRCVFNKNGNVEEALKQVTDNPDLLLRQWATMPLRYYLACELSNYRFFVRNSESCLAWMKDLKRFYLEHICLPSFKMIQSLLLQSKDKESFLRMIAGISGVFLAQDDPADRHNILCIFIYIVCCLIYDRDVISDDMFKIRRLAVMSHMKIHPLTAKAIEDIWFDYVMRDTAFAEDLMTFSERVSTPTGAAFKITDDSEWHPLLPYVRLSIVLEILTELIRKNPIALISFPPLPPELKSLLVCPLTLAVYYDFLSDPDRVLEVGQFVFNMMIHASISYPEDESQPEEIIEAEDLPTLAEKLKGLSFRTFIHTKISYMERECCSAFDLLMKIGDIGRVVARRLSLSLGTIPERTPSQKQLSRERSAEMKRQILMNFENKKKEFESAFTETDEAALDETDLCSICHCPGDSDILVYPALVFSSAVPSFAEHQYRGTKPESGSYKPNRIVKICLHQFHPACEERRFFQCPMDRGLRNAKLPIVKNGTEPITDPRMIQCMDEFFAVFGNDYNIVSLVDDLASQIELLELRHRSNPNCLDARTVSCILRNFYLCIYHRHRSEADFILEDDASFRPLVTLILLKLACGESEFPLARMVIRIAPHLSPMDEYIFLRRAALFQHFCLEERLVSETDRHDWDSILSLDNLLGLYGLPAVSVSSDLPQFRLIELPRTYLGFMKPPFEIDIANNLEFDIGVCLLTGEHCVFPKRNQIIKGLQTDEEMISRVLAGTYTFAFMVTGRMATAVVVSSQEFRVLIRTRSCYLDSFGDENIGLENGSVVSLSQDRVEWLTDQILSSDWVSMVASTRPFR